MSCYPFLTFCNSDDKLLNQSVILGEITFVCKVCSVRNITRSLTNRSQDISFSFFFKHCGSRFENCYVVANTTDKSSGHGIETDAIIEIHVSRRLKSVLANYVFKSHIRYATFSTRQDVFIFQISPLKLFVFVTTNQKRTISFGKLSKHLRIIFFALQINIDSCFRASKSDIHLTRQNSRHNLVGTLAIYEFDIDAVFFKKAKTYCDVLRGIEHRMRNFTNLKSSEVARKRCRYNTNEEKQDYEKGNVTFHDVSSFDVGLRAITFDLLSY